MKAALNDAQLSPEDIDLIIPYGSGIPAYDQAEAAALATIFGDNANNTPLWSSKPYIGTCGAGASAIDIAIAAKAIQEQTIPARINCDQPINGLNAANAPTTKTELNNVMTVSTGMGGQTVSLILQKAN